MRVDVSDHLDDHDRSLIAALLEAAATADRRPALSDHLLLDFEAGGGEGFVAATCWDPTASGPVAYAQASSANDALALEMVIDPSSHDRSERIATDTLDAVLEPLRRRGQVVVTWWIHGHERLAAVAERAGFARTRTLREMRRSLPTERHASVPTRPFVVGRDEEAWVRVNNRAFAGHGEQGGWTVDTLRRREEEPWFDADGFRLHEIDGRLAAFCWTKVHPPTAYQPEAVGEIYVIAVDPDHHGDGLGSELTLAGLDHLSDLGLRSAMLYVDGDNLSAVHLYERLGFRTARVSVAYRLRIEPGGTAP